MVLKAFEHSSMPLPNLSGMHLFLQLVSTVSHSCSLSWSEDNKISGEFIHPNEGPSLIMEMENSSLVGSEAYYVKSML
jgi:hypothetical protein